MGSDGNTVYIKLSLISFTTLLARLYSTNENITVSPGRIANILEKRSKEHRAMLKEPFKWTESKYHLIYIVTILLPFNFESIIYIRDIFIFVL